jgi:alkanesulfonate monooxygenase SsuD/methylene tetrahydromethanopterin reductase-like flavin-dependent oxidoreductase (luciferase family)
MDFGIFNLINRREPGQSVPTLLHQTVEQIQAAEAAGFATAWIAEHHFSNYALTPSPLMMVAHLAAVTTRIKLGTAVILACLYEPARLLGEIGFADALSDGRLILGVGSGYQVHELARFGVSIDQSREMTEEMLDIIEQGFAKGSVEYSGKHFRLPHTYLSLMPTQQGGIPIWIAGNTPPSIALAARRGYPLFASGFGRDVASLVEVRQGAERVWQAEGKSVDSLRFGTLRYCYVTNDKAEARVFAENARYQVRQSQYLRRGQMSLPGAFLPEEGFAGEMSPEELMAWNPIGDAETVAERLASEIKAVNASHMGLYMTMGATSHKGAMRSIERFGSDVLPLLGKTLGPLEKIGVAA